MKKCLFLGISSFMVGIALSPASVLAVEQPSISSTNSLSGEAAQINTNANLITLEEYNRIINIRDEYREIQNSMVVNDKFIELPILQNGVYTLGTFKTQTTENATRNLNFMRKLAGVSELPYSQNDFETAQYGAIGMAASLLQRHGLDDSKKPVDMPDDFWQKAKQSTNSSSIHSHYKEMPLEYHTNTFMVDFGDTNNYALHRSHMLGLANTSVGFGYGIANGKPESGIKYYTSVYASQNYSTMSSRYSNDTIAHWPSEGLFPYELYNIDNPYADEAYANRLGEDYEKNMRWTVHFNLLGYRLTDDIKVTIENTETNETYFIKRDDNSGELNKATVSPNMYGNDGYNTVIFRPNNDFTAEKNVLYKVKIEGILKDGEPYIHEYETKFVGLEDSYKIKAEKIELPQTSEVELNQSVQLNATVLPEEAADKTVVWSTSDESIAVVNEQGKVTGLKEGTATITASIGSGEIQSTCVMTVTPEKPKGMFGTATWTWNQDAQTLSFGNGEFPAGEANANSIRKDIEEHPLLDGLKIKKIIFTAPIKLNVKSNYLFNALYSLEEIEGIHYLDTSEVRMMDNMFSSCSSLKKLDLRSFDTKNVVYMRNMFSGLGRLTELNLSSFDTSNVQYMNSMFNSVASLTELDLSSFDTHHVLNMSAMFDGMKNLTSLNVSSFDTSEVRDMFAMFANLWKIESLDIGHFDTGKVTDMGSMFVRAYELKNLDVSQFNTGNVTNMAAMFSYAKKLSNLDVSSFDTSKVKSMYNLFGELQEVQHLDVSNFDTGNVTDMSGMFGGVSKLTELNLENFNTSKVTKMNGMFSYMTSLSKLDISSFDTGSVTTMNGMFLGTALLDELTLGVNSKITDPFSQLCEKTETPYTGKWISRENTVVYDTTKEFLLNYDGSSPGKYVREVMINTVESDNNSAYDW